MLWLSEDLSTGIIRCDPRYAVGTSTNFDIATVEVWGCGKPSAAAGQDYERKRDILMAEQRRKAKLTVDWAENPDRYLLQLGGVTVDYAQQGGCD